VLQTVENTATVEKSVTRTIRYRYSGVSANRRYSPQSKELFTNHFPSLLCPPIGILNRAIKYRLSCAGLDWVRVIRPTRTIRGRWATRFRKRALSRIPGYREFIRRVNEHNRFAGSYKPLSNTMSRLVKTNSAKPHTTKIDARAVAPIDSDQSTRANMEYQGVGSINTGLELWVAAKRKMVATTIWHLGVLCRRHSPSAKRRLQSRAKSRRHRTLFRTRCLAAHRPSIRGFRVGRKFGTWLPTRFTNLCIDALVRKRQEPAADSPFLFLQFFRYLTWDWRLGCFFMGSSDPFFYIGITDTYILVHSLSPRDDQLRAVHILAEFFFSPFFFSPLSFLFFHRPPFFFSLAYVIFRPPPVLVWQWTTPFPLWRNPVAGFFFSCSEYRSWGVSFIWISVLRP